MPLKREKPTKPKRLRKIDVLKRIYQLLIEGVGDDDIADELGIDPDEFDAKKLDALKAKALEYKQKPPEHVYVEYVIEQKKTLLMLDAVIRNLQASDDPKSGNALVSAIRARSDVLNKLVDYGQSLGMVAKTPEKVIGGFVFEQLSSADMKKLITDELEGLRRIVDASAVPIEQVKIGALHYGESGDPNAVSHVPDNDED